MPKKKKAVEVPKEYFIEEQKITDTLEWNYMPYAMSVIVSRAIPEIDGFKPSHRKLLYTMFKMNLLKGDRTKSSNVVGQTMKLNPHGDSAIYETLVRLTEGNGALLLPFVDSKGNFGKQYSRDMAYAAPRYTEVKLSAVCQEIFADIDKNTVTFVDNYDGSMKEPLLLPTTFPNILVNPNLGIAVGMASSICSFNLKEVCKTTIQLLKNENADILATLKAPDFPTGGQLIYNENELKRIYETGRGNVKVRAKYRYDEKNNCIEIYEIPYTTNIEAIMDKIFSLVKSGKIRDITDVRDETDLNGLKIAIVSSPSGVDDGSFNQNNYEGIQSFIANHPDASVTPVKEESGDTAAAVQAVADIVADYNVIVCCGFQFAGIGAIAQDNPNVNFILVDSNPTDAQGQEINAENIYAMTFAEQESGFYAGVAAALETQSNKVAVVNGIAYPSNVNYQYGFESGVNYANKNLGTSAEVVEIASYAGTDVTGANVGGNYVGTFADEATGKVVGNALINEGCDILFVAAGGSGNGVFTAAKEAGNVKVIGCDVDQYDDGANGDSNVVLTSVLKVMDKNVEKQLNAVIDGTFAGKNDLLGADTDSTGYVKEEGRNQLSSDTITKLDEVYELVKNGTIVPAANFNGILPEDLG